EKHDYKDNKSSKKISKRELDNSIENLTPAFNIIHSPEFEEEFEKLNTSYKYYKIADNFGIVFIDKPNIQDIKSVLTLKSVESAERSARVASLVEISQGTSEGVVATEDIGANFIKNNPNIFITGKGVIIGIIDSGIDYLHEDFIYPDRTSKILYLWDQTKDENPPKGYAIGTEYTREDINKAIENNDSSLSTDEEGQGTMLSGICAGLGNINKQYAGIAEDAELIVIKMKKINGFYNNAMVFAATQYIYEKSKSLKMPAVVNISVGTTKLIETSSRVVKEKLYFAQGFCLVTSAGNEGNTQTHTSGKVEFAGDIGEINLELLEDEDELDIQILINRPDKMAVGIITPSGEPSKILQVANFNYVSGIFDLEGTDYLITYIYPTTYTGQQETTINLKNVKKGIWKIRLFAEYIISGIYHMYLPNRVFLKPGTKFTKPDPLYTINYPATYEDEITVGAYDTKNESLWPSSSRGPTINNSLKPEIVAPGVDIIAPYPGNKYATITGTAVAGAHVSGAVSLFLQYVLVDKLYPNRSFVQQIRPYLETGAKKDPNITYPNINYGYGILDIRGMFEQLR
ncbi:S8 family peptidase, partial [Romboutsia sp.]|uniref:S8 family peptidase n=1 Tax=Romboutsia sp. TaxID=1965302 RepID=UPI002BF38583